MEGGVRLELRSEAGAGAPAIRDCTLAVPGPGGLDADTATEAEEAARRALPRRVAREDDRDAVS